MLPDHSPNPVCQLRRVPLMMIQPHGKGSIAMAKNVKEEGVHFFISENGKPRYFVRLTLHIYREKGQWAGMCPELNTGTSYCDTTVETREQLLALVKLWLDGTADKESLPDWLASQGVALYPIPESLDLENDETVALAEPEPVAISA